MTAIRKRRWMLAIVAVVGTVCVLRLAFSRGDPKEDLPRVRVAESFVEKGQRVFLVQVDAPRHGTVYLHAVSVVEASRNRRIGYLEHDGTAYLHSEAGEQMTVRFTGKPEEFPPNDAFRLGFQMSTVTKRYTLSSLSEGLADWSKTKRLSDLTDLFDHAEYVTIYATPITNAVPRTADAPRP